MGITIDSRLVVYFNLKQLYEKVENTLKDLTGIFPYLHNQRRLICNSFFTEQVSCCPLI